ncbi:hypothetical protein E8E11_009010 [Didymella keratinophila]|nr:hypothetical protein E8E11_009010 [Didymella keratinophila]
MATSILRSVSTPIRTQPKGESEPLPHGGWTGKTEATETRHLSPSTSAKSSYRSTGDVFGAAQNTDHTCHNPFTDKLQNSEDRRYGTPGRYMYREPGSPALGPYQLDASDVASESSYGTFTSLKHHSKKRASTSAPCDGGIIGDESFDALESYIGSDDEEQSSVLESASSLSDEDALTRYQFAVQAPPSQPPKAGSVPRPSQRRAAAGARRRTQESSLAAQAVNSHRPLPLRSYESEATMFLTAGAQACSGHNRSKSVTSIIASRRSTTEPMAAPYVPDPVQARNSLEEIEREFYDRNSSCVKISEQVNREATSTSQRSSSASTLAAFPIPPMDNPVGQLPMLVSRAVSSPQSLRTTTSQHPVALASLDDTYRAIIKVAMDAVLQRTRRQGKELSNVDWHSLTSFERAWREMNAVLLMTIYGRTDAVLTMTDIDYVDHVAEVLRSESDNAGSMDWIRHMFEAHA